MQDADEIELKDLEEHLHNFESYIENQVAPFAYGLRNRASKERKKPIASSVTEISRSGAPENLSFGKDGSKNGRGLIEPLDLGEVEFTPRLLQETGCRDPADSPTSSGQQDAVAESRHVIDVSGQNYVDMHLLLKNLMAVDQSEALAKFVHDSLSTEKLLLKVN